MYNLHTHQIRYTHAVLFCTHRAETQLSRRRCYISSMGACGNRHGGVARARGGVFIILRILYTTTGFDISTPNTIYHICRCITHAQTNSQSWPGWALRLTASGVWGTVGEPLVSCPLPPPHHSPLPRRPPLPFRSPPPPLLLFRLPPPLLPPQLGLGPASQLLARPPSEL